MSQMLLPSSLVSILLALICIALLGSCSEVQDIYRDLDDLYKLTDVFPASSSDYINAEDEGPRQRQIWRPGRRNPWERRRPPPQQYDLSDRWITGDRPALELDRDWPWGLRDGPFPIYKGPDNDLNPHPPPFHTIEADKFKSRNVPKPKRWPIFPRPKKTPGDPEQMRSFKEDLNPRPPPYNTDEAGKLVTRVVPKKSPWPPFPIPTSNRAYTPEEEPGLDVPAPDLNGSEYPEVGQFRAEKLTEDAVDDDVVDALMTYRPRYK